jgi:hypothetical protein
VTAFLSRLSFWRVVCSGGSWGGASQSASYLHSKAQSSSWHPEVSDLVFLLRCAGARRAHESLLMAESILINFRQLTSTTKIIRLPFKMFAMRSARSWLHHFMSADGLGYVSLVHQMRAAVPSCLKGGSESCYI